MKRNRWIDKNAYTAFINYKRIKLTQRIWKKATQTRRKMTLWNKTLSGIKNECFLMIDLYLHFWECLDFNRTLLYSNKHFTTQSIKSLKTIMMMLVVHWCCNENYDKTDALIIRSYLLPIDNPFSLTLWLRFWVLITHSNLWCPLRHVCCRQKFKSVVSVYLIKYWIT